MLDGLLERPFASFIHSNHLGALVFKAFGVFLIHIRLDGLEIEFTQDFLGLELFLDVTVQTTLIDASGRQLLIKILNVQINLEEYRIDRTDDLTELLEPLVRNVWAASKRQVSKLGVRFELFGNLGEAIV